MPEALEIRLGGLDFYGRPGRGPLTIVKDGLDGWDDGVAMRGEKTGRTQAHGAYFEPRHQEPRTITMNGLIMAGSDVEQETVGNQVSGLLADGLEDMIEVAKAGKPSWAMCSLDVASVNPRRGTFWSDFQIVLWCADPRKFGEVRKFTAAVGAPTVAFQWGNHPATPTFIVRGDMPGGYTITIDGWDYQVLIPLTSAAPHRIDYNDGVLRRDGIVINGNLGITNLTTVPKDGRRVGFGLYPITSGTGYAEMFLPETYI